MLTSVHSTSPLASSFSVGQQRQRQIAGGGPDRAAVPGGRHHLPDGFEHVRRGAEFEGAPDELRRQVDLAHAGRERRLHVDDGLLGDAARLADRGDLVDGLDQLGRARPPARHPTAAPPGTAGPRPGASRRSVRRPRRWRPAGPGRRAPWRNARRPRRIRGTADRGRGRRAPPSRRRCPRGTACTGAGCSSSASTTATGRSTWDRPASSSGQLAPVAYTTLPLPSSTSASTPFSFMESRSRAPHSRYIRARSGRSGMSSSAAPGRAKVRHEIPRNFLMLVLTIFTASSGPDRLDDRRQRLLRVAERALVVRVVRRPHHVVDADLVDQPQPERDRP